MTQEALKLALEALTIQSDRVTEIGKQREAITAIKEALREHAMREVQRLGQEIEQEPVAWLSTDSIGERHLCFDKPLDNDPVQPLYTTPPQRTEQEPVAYWKEHAQGLQRDYDSLLADFQAQRTWVGLTDEEKSELWEISRAAWPRYITYASLAEAKLKKRNT